MTSIGTSLLGRGACADECEKVTQLTGANSGGRFPAWSPDGKRIAYTWGRVFADSDVYVMDADGSNPVGVTNRPGYEGDPAWSEGHPLSEAVNHRPPSGAGTMVLAML